MMSEEQSAISQHSSISRLWDDRSSLDDQAGSQDLIAKQLEIEAIAGYVQDGMRVLDAGCGNGVTALELARRYDVNILAIDSSKEMIKAAATRAAGKPGQIRVDFRCVDVLDISAYNGYFDLIYTERVLINLPEQSLREKAMVCICNRLRSGGLYVMCENSADGLDRLNRMRVQLSLPEIVPPWHNHYLDDDDYYGFARAVKGIGVEFQGYNDYSSTYYFLSRIVNAALAAQVGEEPKYDAQINRLALRLPPMGDCGQGRIWLWRRK